jgi:hypothetical protein
MISCCSSKKNETTIPIIEYNPKADKIDNEDVNYFKLMKEQKIKKAFDEKAYKNNTDQPKTENKE